MGRRGHGVRSAQRSIIEAAVGRRWFAEVALQKLPWALEHAQGCSRQEQCSIGCDIVSIHGYAALIHGIFR